MADGEGRTLEEAFDRYAEKKAGEVRERHDFKAMTFEQGLELFETYHPVTIEVKVRPANQWVKGYRVQDQR